MIESFLLKSSLKFSPQNTLVLTDATTENIRKVMTIVSEAQEVEPINVFISYIGKTKYLEKEL
jgi:hypothetical protein